MKNKKSKFHKILKEFLKPHVEMEFIPNTNFNSKTKLKKDLKLDDLDQVELIMTVEMKMNISIPDDKALSLKTVGDYYKFL